MANGRVITGFSAPYVGVYSNTGTTVSYSSGTVLARGVNVSIEPEAAGGDNIFYSDNVAAESAAGVFAGGTLTLTVDGLKQAAEKLIYGLPSPETLTVGSSAVNVTPYGDSMSIPYIGFACVVRYMSGGVTEWVPLLIPKCKFEMSTTTATTQEDAIDWQTQELTATILRDDSSNHNWKKIAEGQSSEAAAIDVIKAWLGITA